MEDNATKKIHNIEAIYCVRNIIIDYQERLSNQRGLTQEIKIRYIELRNLCHKIGICNFSSKKEILEIVQRQLLRDFHIEIIEEAIERKYFYKGASMDDLILDLSGSNFSMLQFVNHFYMPYLKDNNILSSDCFGPIILYESFVSDLNRMVKSWMDNCFIDVSRRNDFFDVTGLASLIDFLKENKTEAQLNNIATSLIISSLFWN